MPQSSFAKEAAQKGLNAQIQVADLSFGHWVSSPEDDEDTASSQSDDAKGNSQLAEESLMCDEEIGECTQRPAKRQRKSFDEVVSNTSPAEPFKHSPWPMDDRMQVADVWFQLCMPHHVVSNNARPLQLCMHA